MSALLHHLLQFKWAVFGGPGCECTEAHACTCMSARLDHSFHFRRVLLGGPGCKYTEATSHLCSAQSKLHLILVKPWKPSYDGCWQPYSRQPSCMHVQRCVQMSALNSCTPAPNTSSSPALTNCCPMLPYQASRTRPLALARTSEVAWNTHSTGQCSILVASGLSDTRPNS